MALKCLRRRRSRPRATLRWRLRQGCVRIHSNVRGWFYISDIHKEDEERWCSGQSAAGALISTARLEMTCESSRCALQVCCPDSLECVWIVYQVIPAATMEEGPHIGNSNRLGSFNNMPGCHDATQTPSTSWEQNIQAKVMHSS